MKEPITYKLDFNGSATSSYYPEVSAFTNYVLARAEESLTPIAHRFRKFIIDYELEDPRTSEEYTFELLNFGILWRIYGNTALEVKIAPFRLLAYLSEWRKKHQRFKPIIDYTRGILMSLFLASESQRRMERSPKSAIEIGRLVEWLEATGDFQEDALRFIRWLGYWETLSRQEFSFAMENILAFSDWFEKEGLNNMGVFTPNVDSFVENNSTHYRWRDDRFTCLRSRAEYHLNMIGTEIMNRAFRSEFLSVDKRTVLVPGCMRIRQAHNCEGKKTVDGVQCIGCEAKCHVNQIRLVGLKHNFDVVVMPHSSDLSRWATKPGAPSIGVVGVACLSVLVQGGWELKRYNVPAQCVLLNQCGCKNHWDAVGFPTKLDIRELKKIVSVTTPQSVVSSVGQEFNS
jgi:uncharacterized protein